MESRRVLIIGGYGTFGGRLTRLLADEPRLNLLVAGRSLENARMFCDRLDGSAQCTPAQFDCDDDVLQQIRSIAPDIVIDSCEPFQAYGADAYRVVEACLALRIPYLDLADDPRFVEGIAQFDSPAKKAGIFVLSGVSTVPALSTAVIVRSTLDGVPPKPGARACTNDVDLEDYEKVFAQHGIVTGARERNSSDAALPLYRQYLGAAWSELPEPLRAMHDATGTWIGEGRADIERGTNPLARIAAFVNRFPKAGRDVPIAVTFEAKDGHEIWTRNFAGKRFSSVQYEGRGRDEGLICERFGPLVFAMALVIAEGKMQLVVRQWRAFGIPLPRFLMPVGNTFENAEDGKFHFHVEIGFPWTGLIVRYRGWLVRR